MARYTAMDEIDKLINDLIAIDKNVNHNCEVWWEDWHYGNIQWHHPISTNPEVGCWLCQGHHSLIQGRKERYPAETIFDKTNEERATRIEKFVIGRVKDKGFSKYDIDKK
jgi:hypothetical protein